VIAVAGGASEIVGNTRGSAEGERDWAESGDGNVIGQQKFAEGRIERLRRL
jgi:hypothetical protein